MLVGNSECYGTSNTIGSMEIGYRRMAIKSLIQITNMNQRRRWINKNIFITFQEHISLSEYKLLHKPIGPSIRFFKYIFWIINLEVLATK